MELTAPAHWRRIDFISDLHLQASAARTLATWQAYLQHTPADALFILGDLFEVWVGDDVLAVPDSFESACAAHLRACAAHCNVFIQCGNRDFLMGPALMQACGAQALEEPTTLVLDGLRAVLSHGDALCLDDRQYMEFRAMVRSAPWQSSFLARPLAERQAIARGLREQSEQQKKSGVTYADVDTPAAVALLQEAQATVLVHGHTHRPADHAMSGGLQRRVLSDWDMDSASERAEVLSLQRDSAGPWRFERKSLAGSDA